MALQLPTTLLHFALPSPRPGRRTNRAMGRALVVAAASKEDGYGGDGPNSTKLVTFLGKGGSGKTTAAVFAAQHYALAGLNTCLVIHTQDPTAECLLNCKIGTSPIICNSNLSAVRLETTKMVLEPLNRLKQADARLNITQGVLEGVVGEELGVLPGMDSIFSALTLERLVGFSGNAPQGKDKYDVIVYDGISTDETLRMLGAASKARLYLKYLRNLAEKTDFGRLAGPSIMRLVDDATGISGSNSVLNGPMSAQIWDKIEKMLERGASVFEDPSKFECFLMMDLSNPVSLRSAMRYWGCTVQAGAQVSGALAVSSPHLDAGSVNMVKTNFSPLPFVVFPRLSMDSQLDWNAIMLNTASVGARGLLSSPASQSRSSMLSSVKFDVAKRSVTLLMPGFDKSEIKLYQYRGGSELLVEAGDQRRAIFLPQEIQGKVQGAKFLDRSLVITIR